MSCLARPQVVQTNMVDGQWVGSGQCHETWHAEATGQPSIWLKHVSTPPTHPPRWREPAAARGAHVCSHGLLARQRPRSPTTCKATQPVMMHTPPSCQGPPAQKTPVASGCTSTCTRNATPSRGRHACAAPTGALSRRPWWHTPPVCPCWPSPPRPTATATKMSQPTRTPAWLGSHHTPTRSAVAVHSAMSWPRHRLAQRGPSLPVPSRHMGAECTDMPPRCTYSGASHQLPPGREVAIPTDAATHTLAALRCAALREHARLQHVFELVHAVVDGLKAPLTVAAGGRGGNAGAKGTQTMRPGGCAVGQHGKGSVLYAPLACTPQGCLKRAGVGCRHPAGVGLQFSVTCTGVPPDPACVPQTAAACLCFHLPTPSNPARIPIWLAALTRSTRPTRAISPHTYPPTW